MTNVIINRSYDEIVLGTNGTDSIINSGDYATIMAKDGDDTIKNNADDVSINGGDGNDKIFTMDCYSTIMGGTGNDTIKFIGEGNVIEYGEGDGNDVIIGYNPFNTIHLTSGAIKNVAASDNDVILGFGINSSIQLKDAKGIPFNIQNVDDSITRLAWNGNTTIETIYNEAEEESITGTSSADYIYNLGSNVEINAGKGNDTIETYANSIIKYSKGDGNDHIISTYGYPNEVTLDLPKGTNITSASCKETDKWPDYRSKEEYEHSFYYTTFKIGSNTVTVDYQYYVPVRIANNNGYNYYQYVEGKKYNDLTAEWRIAKENTDYYDDYEDYYYDYE